MQIINEIFKYFTHIAVSHYDYMGVTIELKINSCFSD